MTGQVSRKSRKRTFSRPALFVTPISESGVGVAGVVLPLSVVDDLVAMISFFCLRFVASRLLLPSCYVFCLRHLRV